MKPNTAKWLWTILILLINVILWAIPSDVAYLIAQQRDVLLGRYDVSRFTILLLLIPITAAALYLIRANQENKRKRQFQVIALSVSVLVSIPAMDVFLRLIERKNYVGQSNLYHRPPNTIQTGITRDIPEAAFSYPTSPAGYPDIEFTLTVDKRGFRNKTNLPRYDIAAIGDSFTEGSGVSDDRTWPAVLAQKSDRSVYNLGMSGGNATTYTETLKRFLPELSPQTVICMLYEGNDFRDFNFDKKAGFTYNLESCFKTSPLRRIILNSFIRYLGDTGSNQQINKMLSGLSDESMKALSWLPAAVPDGPDGKYYAFKVKALLAHLTDKTSFLKSTGCRKTFEAMQELKKICEEKNIRFIIAYAPDKPHLLLPLIRQKLTDEQLHAFLSLKEKNLPSAENLIDTVLASLDVRESATEEFCRQNSMEFVSLTKPLLDTIAQGRQAYFTYDQHWTPTGQQAAAETIYNYLQTTSSSHQACN